MVTQPVRTKCYLATININFIIILLIKKNYLLKFLFVSKIILTKRGQPTILVGALHWTLGSRLLSSHMSPLYIINTKIC